jgi:iron-sulfur cluster assembly protein
MEIIMTLAEQTVTKSITLTQSAAEAVRDIINEKNLQGYALRLFVSGGGCSGYQYGLALDNRNHPEDTVIEAEGVKLVIDEVSIQYLQGATVDYINDMPESGFKIYNPNMMPSCGCGQNSNSAGGDPEESCTGCG